MFKFIKNFFFEWSITPMNKILMKKEVTQK